MSNRGGLDMVVFCNRGGTEVEKHYLYIDK